jgi:hypothetical protein
MIEPAARAMSTGRVEDRRRFSAQLQRRRRQVLRRSLRDEASDRRRSGEDQMIEWQFREGLADLGVAENDEKLLRLEIFAGELRHQFGRARRQLRGLRHNAVAGGEGRQRRPMARS